jgi:hypothetical protein
MLVVGRRERGLGVRLMREQVDLPHPESAYR